MAALSIASSCTRAGFTQIPWVSAAFRGAALLGGSRGAAGERGFKSIPKKVAVTLNQVRATLRRFPAKRMNCGRPFYLVCLFYCLSTLVLPPRAWAAPAKQACSTASETPTGRVARHIQRRFLLIKPVAWF